MPKKDHEKKYCLIKGQKYYLNCKTLIKQELLIK